MRVLSVRLSARSSAQGSPDASSGGYCLPQGAFASHRGTRNRTQAETDLIPGKMAAATRELMHDRLRCGEDR